MSDVATAIGSVFVGMSGEAAASCSKACQSKSKGIHQLFFDAAPLARLREETRSNKEQAADVDRPGQVGEPENVERLAEPRASVVSSSRPQPESEDVAAEPAEEESVPPEVTSAAGEVETESNASVEALSNVMEGAAEPATVETEVVNESGVTLNADASLADEHQLLSAVAQTSFADASALSQVQTGATLETADGQQRSVQSAVTVSVSTGNVEVSAEVRVADDLPDDMSDNALSLPGQTAASEDTDTAAGVVKEQTGEPVDTQAKTVPLELEVADTPGADDVEGATKPQEQARPEAQVSAEVSKEAGFDKAAITSRGPQTAQHGLDNNPRDDGQTSSRQDLRTVSQDGVQVVPTPEPDKQASAPGFEGLAQPQVESAVVAQDDATAVSVRLSAPTPDSSGLGAGATKSPVQDVGEQILSSVHASLARAGKQVQTRLDPPELGTVLVRLSEQGDQIRGFLEVSRDETRREIEQALPQVLKGLQDAGVQVRRLEVVVSDQPDRGVGREQSQQDAWAQQHQNHSDQQGYRPQNASAINWSVRTGFPQSRTARDGLQTQGAQDRIDMLV